MSSVHRLSGKPNWICFYTDRNGTRRCKSTLTNDKRQADRVCAEIQKIEDRARSGRLTEDRARKVIESTVAEIMESFGAPIQQRTIEEHFRSWLKAAEAELSKKSFPRYRGVVDRFLDFLGPKRRGALGTLTSTDVSKYRDTLIGRLANNTVNTHLKVIRVCLEKAYRENVFDKNPARLVENLDRKKEHNRRPFTVPEIKKLLSVASEDWRTMIMLGLYTGGQRLSDVANLNWTNLDLQTREVSLVTSKTGRTIILPIAAPLLRHIEALPAGDTPRAPLSPTLNGKPESWLSNQFYELMASAGLVRSRVIHDAENENYRGSRKGRGAKRRLSEISFHSLRYTTTSLLKNAGVSDVVARDIVGHESAAVSRNYTVIETDTKRQALEKLPDVSLEAKDV